MYKEIKKEQCFNKQSRSIKRSKLCKKESDINSEN